MSKSKLCVPVALIVALGLLLTLSASVAQADLIGFPLGTYEYNPGDAGSPPVLTGTTAIQLTTGNGQRRSIFFYEKQDVTKFTASFDLKATNVNGSLVWQGITLLLQNNAAGVDALGGGNGGLGFNGVANSAAVTMQLDTGPGRTYNGFFTNGVLASGAADLSPVNAFSGQPIHITVNYANPVLSVRATNDSSGIYSRDYLVGSLSSIVGGPTAFVGFTASTGDGFGNGGGNFTISNFRFVPEPSSVAMAGSGAMLAAAFAWRRRKHLRPLLAKAQS